MKKLLSLFLSITLILGLMAIPAFAETGTGNSSDDPIVIESLDDFLKYFKSGVAASMHNGRYFKLDCDINLPADYKSATVKFAGFDGNGHTIDIQMEVNDATYPAVFSEWCSYDKTTLHEYYIKNLTVTGKAVSTDSTKSAGGVVAMLDGYGTFTFTNVTNRATVQGGRAAGGILGNFYCNSADQDSVETNKATVHFINCKNYGEVKSKFSGWGGAGGIVGFYVDQNQTPTGESTLTDCVNYGNIYSDVNAGGLVGLTGYKPAFVNLKITNCSNYGNISRNSDATQTAKGFGGIVGQYLGTDGSSLKIQKTFNAGNVSVNSKSCAAGIVGAYKNAINLEITDCFNAGNISYSGDGFGCGTISSSYIGTTAVIRNFYHVGDFTTGGDYPVDNKLNKVTEGDDYTYYKINTRPVYGLLSGKTITDYPGVENNYFIECFYDENGKLKVYSDGQGAKELTVSQMAEYADTLGENWVKSTVSETNAYPFPQIKGNPYVVAPKSGTIDVIEETPTLVFATGKAEDNYSVNGIDITTDYAVVFTKCADMDYAETEFGMLLSKDGEDFTDAKNAKVIEDETFSRGANGGFGVLFYGEGLTPGTYYVKPYAKYTAVTGDTIEKFGDVVSFTISE